VPIERAVLVSAPTKDVAQRDADEHLQELGRLTDTAGASVEATLRQRLDAPHPKYYIGEGKVAELKELVRAHGGTLVVFDEELSPAQGKNL
jgi:GTP-binding protein HflX